MATFTISNSKNTKQFDSVDRLNKFLFSDECDTSYDCLEISGGTLGETDGVFIDVLPFIKVLKLNGITLKPHAINRCPELEKIEFTNTQSTTVSIDSIFYAPKLTELHFKSGSSLNSNLAYFINSGYFTITKITIESGVTITFGYKDPSTGTITGCLGQLSNRGGVVYYTS